MRQPLDNSRIPKFGGIIWYVNGTMGDDTNPGTDPRMPLATIGQALANCASGDAINIFAADYDENGLDVGTGGTKHNLEIWGEIGAEILDTTTGAQTLLVSGNHCLIKGYLDIEQAGQTGIKVTGDECWLEDVIVRASSIAFDIDGDGTVMIRCAAGGYTTTGYDMAGAVGLCRTLSATGTGGATRGYYLSAGTADYNTFNDCSSIGNATAGFDVVTGCAFNKFLNCSSGGGDGPKLDADNASMWSHYDFDNELFHTTTFTGAGSTDNLFQVFGGVEIQFVYGTVVTALNADVDSIYLELWDGTVPIEITDNGAGGTDTDSAGLGSQFIKTEIATTAITMMKSDQGRLVENTDKKPRNSFILNQKASTDTFIRLVWDGVATDGAILWHIHYDPLSAGAYIVAV